MPDAVIEDRLGESSRNPRTFATPMRAICGAHCAGFQLDPHEGETLHGLGPVPPLGQASGATAAARATAGAGLVVVPSAGADAMQGATRAATSRAVRARRTWDPSAPPPRT